jgi:hypothetical protein
MLEIAGQDGGLLDEPLAVRLRGAGPAAQVVWHARLRDDDGLVFRARAERPEDLPAAWRGKAAHAALGSLRPVRIDVRAETADGRAATRTLTRRIVGDGVRIRRWRDGPRATLHLPGDTPRATALVDARDGAGTLLVAAPLLASRGVIVLVLTAGEPSAAREALAAVPAAGDVTTLDAAAVPVPPGAPGGDAARWGALLVELGALEP